MALDCAGDGVQISRVRAAAVPAAASGAHFGVSHTYAVRVAALHEASTPRIRCRSGTSAVAFDWPTRGAQRNGTRLLLLSDTQSDSALVRQLVAHALAAGGAAGAPRAVLFGGDATQNNKPLQLARFAAALAPAQLPVVFANGNHDISFRRGDRLSAALLRGEGAGEHERLMRVVNFGRVSVLVLDANEKLMSVAVSATERRAFNASLLAHTSSAEWTDACFRVVLCHIPQRIEYWEPRAWNRGGEWKASDIVANLLRPLADQVDIVVSGHAHMYAYRRTSAHEFTIGGGGGELESERVVPEDRTQFSFVRLVHHYVDMRLVSPCIIDWRAVGLDGERFFHQLRIPSKRCCV